MSISLDSTTNGDDPRDDSDTEALFALEANLATHAMNNPNESMLMPDDLVTRDNFTVKSKLVPLLIAALCDVEQVARIVNKLATSNERLVRSERLVACWMRTNAIAQLDVCDVHRILLSAQSVEITRALLTDSRVSPITNAILSATKDDRIEIKQLLCAYFAQLRHDMGDAPIYQLQGPGVDDDSDDDMPPLRLFE